MTTTSTTHIDPRTLSILEAPVLYLATHPVIAQIFIALNPGGAIDDRDPSAKFVKSLWGYLFMHGRLTDKQHDSLIQTAQRRYHMDLTTVDGTWPQPAAVVERTNIDRAMGAGQRFERDPVMRAAVNTYVTDDAPALFEVVAVTSVSKGRVDRFADLMGDFA